MNLITPAVKDKILFYICETFPLEKNNYFDNSEILEKTGTDLNVLRGVLNQFERLHFLRDLGVGDASSTFRLQGEAHDYLNKGGFELQEEIFDANIHKLQLEIDNLKKDLGPDHLDRINKISGITSAIVAGLTLFQQSKS